MSTLKFKLTDEFITFDNRKLYRIEALKDFSDVKKGDKGGFVESEANLSQLNDCWLYDDAKVYDNALVFGDAKVFHNARVFMNARVYDFAIVFGEVRIFGNTEVFGNTNVKGYKTICGNVSEY